jgi:hypothetical protein
MKALLLVAALFVQNTFGQSNELAAVTARLAAIQTALAGYYYITNYADTGDTSIRPLEPLHLGEAIRLQTVSITEPAEAAPASIILMVVGEHGTLGDHCDIALHWGDTQKNFGDLEPQNKADFDSCWPKLTMAEYRGIAWAESASIKINGTTYAIPKSERVKWKLLWNYYDLRRQKKELTLAELTK